MAKLYFIIYHLKSILKLKGPKAFKFKNNIHIIINSNILNFLFKTLY